MKSESKKNKNCVHDAVPRACSCTTRRPNSYLKNASTENTLLASKVAFACEDEFKTIKDSLFSYKQTGEEDLYSSNGASSYISLMNSLTSTHDDETRNEWGPQSRQRAEALEVLLEICSYLLKQQRFEELAGVLRPFGEEAVSSRETAIWLTQTLMNVQRTGSGA